MTSLASDVEQYLLEVPSDSNFLDQASKEVREEDPAIMALSEPFFLRSLRRGGSWN